jgi:hypothetical protein
MDAVKEPALPVREGVGRIGGGGRRPAAGRAIDDAFGDLRAHVRLSRGHPPDGREEIRDRPALHHQAARPGPQGTLRVQHLVVHRQHEQLHAGLARRQRADEVEAVVVPQ